MNYTTDGTDFAAPTTNAPSGYPYEAIGGFTKREAIAKDVLVAMIRSKVTGPNVPDVAVTLADELIAALGKEPKT